MALIQVFEDVFDISRRVKEINDGYFVVYNTKRERYEVHNKLQKGSTFCITCENGLNYSVITKLRKTRIENIDRIIREIDESNKATEQENSRMINDEATFKLKEMFDYAQKREDDCNFNDSYKTVWV